MRKPPLNEELARLQKAAGAPLSDQTLDTLRDALKGSQGILAALAAETVGTRRIADLEPELVRAFNRFMANPEKGCQARIAIVTALNRMECDAEDVYLRGIRTVQKEPAFGEPVDTAADLRAGCAVMLVNMRHPQALMELTSLLVDPELNPRKTAVKALAQLGTDGAEAVIRLKALIGDREPEILGECFNALMSISPSQSTPFVARFLESSPEVAEQAALSLGQSHQAEAFEKLRECWDNNLDPSFRAMLLLPIALLRRDDAFEFMLDVVENSGPKLAVEAVKALYMYADDKSRRRIKEAVKRNGSKPVHEAFTREFGAE